MTQKIQKILSHLGYGSRRNIEKMIISRDISINGQIISIGQRLDIHDCVNVVIKGKKVVIKNNNFKTKIIIYNKPEGEICTRKDTKKRTTVFEKIPFLNIHRWVSIGRLDINTRGLLLFTNNGDLANQLMHPKNQIEREYYIRVFGNIDKNKINILKNGIKVKDSYLSFKSIDPINDQEFGKNKWFKGIVCEGKNREIRLMWEAVQCQVNRLIRIRYGNIILPKNLKMGHWSELNANIICHLCNLIRTQKQ